MNLVEVSKAQFAARHVSTLDATELGDLLRACNLIASIHNEAEKEAEARLESGKPVDGFELIPGRPTSSIMDPAAAFRILEPIIGENDLLDCATLGLGKLEKAIHRVRGGTLKEAKEFMAEKIGIVILTEPGKPKLSPIIKSVEIAVSTETAEAT